ncbi:MAG: hypothetical protein IPP97_17325 [Candidatus Obscuribacter sp.]|nr:hypothetical protein [Candidatus Obscuribacter sp.]
MSRIKRAQTFGYQSDNTKDDNGGQRAKHRSTGCREFAATSSLGEVAVYESCGDALKKSVGQPP